MSLAATTTLFVAVAAAVPVGAQQRVDSGLRLKMTDRLEGTSARVGTSESPVPSDREARASPEEGAGLPIRGITLQLTSGIRFDDNVFRADRNEQRDAIVVLQPKVYANGRLGRHDIRLGYEGDIARHQQIGSENYFNHGFLANADVDISRILKSRLEASLRFGTDARGDLTTRPFDGAEPDRWRRHGIGGGMTLGRRIAKAQFGVRYGVEGTRYINNAQSDRDFDERRLALTGRYNLSPRFAIVGELGGAWFDYLSPTSTLDSREYTALAGVAWEATAKTRGEIKLGLLHRDFHAPSRSSERSFNWDARVNWAPKSFSQVTAYTSREVTESAFGGPTGSGTAVTDIYGLRWRHGFSERLTLDTGVEYAVSDFDPGGDEFMRYDAGLRYKVGRGLDLFGEWSQRTRSAQTGNYEAGMVFIGIDMRLDRPFGR